MSTLNLLNKNGELICPETTRYGGKPTFEGDLEHVREAVLAALRADFDRGIVKIREAADVEDFKAALREDPGAGQNWETVMGRLTDQNHSLLDQVGAMPGTGTLIGVYDDGGLAFRQRDPHLVRGIYEKPEREGLTLLPHAETEALRDPVFATPWELLLGVRQTAYHLGGNRSVPFSHDRWPIVGHMAAFMAVTEEPYALRSNGGGWQAALLDSGYLPPVTLTMQLAELAAENKIVMRHVLQQVRKSDETRADGDYGVMLWLKG